MCGVTVLNKNLVLTLTSHRAPDVILEISFFIFLDVEM